MIVRFTNRATADLDAIFGLYRQRQSSGRCESGRANRIAGWQPFAIPRQGPPAEATACSEVCGNAVSVPHPLSRGAKPFGGPDPSGRAWRAATAAALKLAEV